MRPSATSRLRAAGARLIEQRLCGGANAEPFRTDFLDPIGAAPNLWVKVIHAANIN
jgi:hypothetical protein